MPTGDLCLSTPKHIGKSGTDIGLTESMTDNKIQYYVIKIVSDLRKVDGFLRVLRILPPIKLTATI
jgi:hypothetical protein